MEDPSFRMLKYVSTQFKDCFDSSLMAENAALKKELAEVKLQLFWEGHKYENLQKLMTMANHSHEALRCSCQQCHTYSMFSGEQSPAGVPHCLFKPWFQGQLTACGLTFSEVVEANASVFSRCGKMHKMYDVDADFVEVRHYLSAVTYASKYIYGRRILLAKSVDADALKKLARLFEAIKLEIDVDLP
jgi:hypothetical protein